MTIKVLDAGGIERTISQVKVMDAGNVERTIAFIRVMDAGNVVREVFTAGGTGGGGSGGGGGTDPTVSISPSYVAESGRKPPSRSAIFTANRSGTDPATYHWGVVSGPGAVSADGTSANATLTVFGDLDQTAEAIFFCDITIGSQTYRATCTFSFDYTG